MSDIKEVLAAAIELERFGREYYIRFHELVADKKAKVLMKSLAEDEREHEEALVHELRKVGGKAKRASKEVLDAGLAEIFPAEMPKNSIERHGAISAIKFGMGTEERSIKFYSKNAAAAGPKLKAVFEALAKMEKGHLELLKENLHYLQDDGVWYGYLPILD